MLIGFDKQCVCLEYWVNGREIRNTNFHCVVFVRKVIIYEKFRIRIKPYQHMEPRKHNKSIMIMIEIKCKTKSKSYNRFGDNGVNLQWSRCVVCVHIGLSTNHRIHIRFQLTGIRKVVEFNISSDNDVRSAEITFVLDLHCHHRFLFNYHSSSFPNERGWNIPKMFHRTRQPHIVWFNAAIVVHHYSTCTHIQLANWLCHYKKGSSSLVH